MNIIDLRSDTVTTPSAAMRAVMAEAEVGDDVYGEDPTVNRLESLAAGMLGTQAAVFAASGTQSNLMALLSHCERGDEYIVGQHAHTYKYEGGGAAVLGSIQPQPLDLEPDGTLNLEQVARAIKPDDPHFARTRLLCLENTQAGKILPLEYLERAAELARDRGLALHLDGARAFNAAVKLKVPITAIAEHFDSVSICLSKGLGAPVGSVLCGSAEVVKRARRWRKVLGGGMRQAGIVAAAGIFALERNVERLEEDHHNARSLADGLADVEKLKIDPRSVQTNMAFLSVDRTIMPRLLRHLEDNGIRMSEGEPIRLVTHLDVSSDDVDHVVRTVKKFLHHG